MSHFLVITEESYDASTIYGIYDTYEDAVTDTERRTIDRAQDADNEDYGVDRAEIQQWDGATRTAWWERNWGSPLIWEKHP